MLVRTRQKWLKVDLWRGSEAGKCLKVFSVSAPNPPVQSVPQSRVRPWPRRRRPWPRWRIPAAIETVTQLESEPEAGISALGSYVPQMTSGAERACLKEERVSKRRS